MVIWITRTGPTVAPCYFLTQTFIASLSLIPTHPLSPSLPPIFWFPSFRSLCRSELTESEVEGATSGDEDDMQGIADDRIGSLFSNSLFLLF